MPTTQSQLQPQPRLNLYDFSNLKDAFSNLAFSLPNSHGPSPRMVPLTTALSHIGKLGCNAIIKQHAVQDPDFSAEYHAYYSRMFGQVDKFCHRFHFFSTPIIPNESALDFIDRASKEKDCYLGFITIRPVRSSPVAATILRALENQNFLLSSDHFDVHLAGQEFKVCGTPFMQQDNAVGACAQASIWMALRTLRKKEGNSAFDPAQITSAATRFLVRGRTLPNREGLAVDQMIEAIRFANYSPHIMQFSTAPAVLQSDDLRIAKRKIYAYVESEIPVVLGVFPSPAAGHAIVLIGHRWQANHNPTPYNVSNGLTLFHAADWVTNFIAHNDNTGPYIDLPETTTGDYRLDQVKFAIPLLPNDVFMTGEEAEAVAENLLFNAFQPGSQSNSEAHSQSIKEQLVVRTYLIDRHQFRKWVTDNTGIHPDVKEYYRLKVFPKRIWITEINLLSQYNGTCNGSLSRVGEIIIDPTGEPNDAPFLSIHLNISCIMGLPSAQGVIFDRAADSKDIRAIPISGDTLYSALCRK